jgi:hypothetical protein
LKYLGLLLLAACAVEPATDTPISPTPSLYREWWSEVETCVRRQGSFDRVRWFEADLASQGKAGYRVGNTIWLDHGFTQHELVVKHEIFHVLGGSGDHHEPEWQRCHLTWESNNATD